MSSLKKKLPKEGGFTIIEVVLVLAIAGLIFLIVFLALPQLQRSRRDTQRRADAGRVVAALESYAQNNNGSYPNDATITDQKEFRDLYLTVDSSVFADPQGGDYTLIASGKAAIDAAPAPGGGGGGAQMLVKDGSICGTANSDGTSDGNSRDFAVVVAVEEGGTYCQDNR